MEPKPYFHLLLCIFLILLLNPFLVSTRSISTHQHQHDHSEILSPPLDFLDNMIGSRKGNTSKDLSQLKIYLSNLGYISSHNIKHEYDDLFDDNLELAIKRYQRFFKLDVTGVLDDNTVNTMKQPRCGLPDLFEETMFDSKYAFFPGKPRWPATKRNLTYSFPAGIRDDVKEAIRVASGLWTGVSPFKFTYIQDFEKADIKISFKYWNHGDGFPFNGPRGVLAQ
ncbi:hypothetical protein CASFOL_003023 [Castilleja foliolosa]|uniref:Matrix metalloproteinase n=1 Tax=Castilleja foliolosa TaxID=1961234 RepID=A0ABD3EG05_9LAMI